MLLPVAEPESVYVVVPEPPEVVILTDPLVFPKHPVTSVLVHPVETNTEELPILNEPVDALQLPTVTDTVWLPLLSPFIVNGLLEKAVAAPPSNEYVPEDEALLPERVICAEPLDNPHEVFPNEPAEIGRAHV